MKTIQNNYHKKLIFPLLSISIGADEIKTVSDTQAAEMIINKWIVLYEKPSFEKKDGVMKKNKGRK